MVVTRRTPAQPAPASRTNSTQPVPRLAKKATQDTQGVPNKSSPLANGTTHAASPAGDVAVDKANVATAKSNKAKQKAKKGGKKSRRGSTGFVELLFRMALLWFTIYTLSVCPQDEDLKSPVCRGLSEYRRLVIEPYILPPIQQTLEHPSVAPYIEQAKPYADYAVRTAKPIAARVHKEFNARVVPQWNKRVVPLYLKYAVPQLMKLDAQAAPYRTRIQQDYERLLAPYVNKTTTVLSRLQRQARPYVILAAQKSYQGYQFARPYARPIWEKVKVILAQLAAVVGEQRRQFVDPHVKKIWEHVKEMSGKPQTSPASQLRSSASSKLSTASSRISNASEKLASHASSIASSVLGTPSASSSSQAASSSDLPPGRESFMRLYPEKDQPTIKAKAISRQTSSSSSSSASSAASSAVSSLPSSVVSAASDAIVSSASSVASAAESVVDAPLKAASSLAEVIPPAISTLVESATGAAAGAGSAPSSEATPVESSAPPPSNLIASSSLGVDSVTVTPQAVASVPEPADSLPSIIAPSEDAHASDPDLADFLSDPDLDAFKAELGLTDDFLEGKKAEAPPPPPAAPQGETEAEREERERQRAEKAVRDRIAVEKRHTEWEHKVEELIATNKKLLRKTLVATRKAVVAELKENDHLRRELDSLAEDAEKFLRGAEKYMAKLQKEGRTLEEKKAVWDRVVDKLEEKFSDRLHQAEAVVDGWYQGALAREIAERDRLTNEVMDLAQTAQGDIGLDYAWLDTVSYNDWQRYHDLVRRAENFTALALTVQDGTHPSPPINPVINLIIEVQDEIEDVTNGFNARLRAIKRNGGRAFGSPDAAADDEDGTASILPIEQPEHTAVPADADANIPPVFIGRGKEEVEAALNRVADLEGQKTSSPDEPEKVKDADAVAQSLGEAVASEQTASSSPQHQEL